MERAATFVFSLLLSSVGYNIDIHHAVVRRGPHERSFFGYSVAQYSNSDAKESWMIVGAPLDNITSALLMSKNVEHPGTVYRCNIARGGDCEPIIVDQNYSYVDTFNDQSKLVRTERDILENQWLGSSVAAIKQGTVTATEKATTGLIIVCAHRYADRGLSARHWYPVGQCSIVNKNFTVLEKLTPCKDTLYLSGIRGISYCQSGVSAIISDDGLVVAFGAPGAYVWKGIIQYTQPYSNEVSVESTDQYGDDDDDAYAYLGYSSDFAKFNWKNGSHIYYVVTGAPRQNGYFGRAIVFEYDSIAENIDTRNTLAGPEFGAYFGHSVAALDLNGDGFDDLLVGAPLYSERRYEQGAVYVYLNDGKAQLERDRVFLLGNIVGGRFGHAIAKARDLNADSFDDAVISAPYTTNGGIIYIYHGYVGGIKEKPSQIIMAENFNLPGLTGLGVSLSAGMDMDDNEYPDILVGAYTSDTAILLRSRPVVDSIGTITAKPQFLNYPKVTRVIVEVCLQYSGRNLPNSLVFGYNLTVDESRTNASLYPRAAFDGQQSAIKGNVTLSLGSKSCVNSILELLKNNSIIDKVNPIVTTLTYQLAKNGSVNPSKGDPDVTQRLSPVLRSQSIHSNSTEIFVLEYCGEDNACIPDLQITSRFVNISGKNSNTFVIGSISEIVVVVSVRNDKESAYNARLIATFPRELILSSPLSCDNQRESKSQVTCSLGSRFGTNKTSELKIRMSVSELRIATKSFQVELEAVSDNPENLTLGDNSWLSPAITTTGEAKFELYGKAVPDRVLFNLSRPSVDVTVPPENENQIGPLVTHRFSVLNSGPSPVGQSDLFILWPLLLDQDNDSYLLYLTDVKAPESAACDLRWYKDPLGILRIGRNNNEAESRKRRSQRISSSLSPNTTPETIVAECENDNQICIHCRLQSFANEAGADITVISRLYERTLVKKSIKELDISSTAVHRIPETDNLKIIGGNLNYKRLHLALATQITEPSEVELIETWVIVVAIIGTALFDIALIVILYLLGFFKRTEKGLLEREEKELSTDGEELMIINADSADDAFGEIADTHC